MANETLLGRFKQAAVEFGQTHPGNRQPDVILESLDPLFTTYPSFSDFLKRTYRPLIEQQEEVKPILSLINDELIDRPGWLAAVENYLIHGREDRKIVPISNGWSADISHEEGVVKTSLFDSIPDHEEVAPTRRYTVSRNIQTKEAEYEAAFRLANGAEFIMKKTFSGEYEINFRYKNRLGSEEHDIYLKYGKTDTGLHPTVVFDRKRPIRGEKGKYNTIYYHFEPVRPDETTGLLSINKEIVDCNASAPYDLSTIFSVSLGLLKEISSQVKKLH